jgi:hypothetical protein
MRRVASCVAGVCLAATTALARKHTLVIEKDDRFVFSIESFGFLPNGEVKATISNVEGTAKRAGLALAPVRTLLWSSLALL